MKNPEAFRKGDIIPHGSYCQFAGTELVRHKYAAWDVEDAIGYLEVLSFPHPPPGHLEFVCVIYLEPHGFTVIQFDNLLSAMNFGVTYQILKVIEGKRKVPGYLRGRHTYLGDTLPWFYNPPPIQKIERCKRWNLDMAICQGHIAGNCPEKVKHIQVNRDCPQG